MRVSGQNMCSEFMQNFCRLLELDESIDFDVFTIIAATKIGTTNEGIVNMPPTSTILRNKAEATRDPIG